jgi:hypothetical protein
MTKDKLLDQVKIGIENNQNIDLLLFQVKLNNSMMNSAIRQKYYI